jgi:integrase/recombinase XerD
MTPTAYLSLDKRKMSTTGENTGKYHAKLWVTFKVIKNGERTRDQQPYKTGYFLTAEDYDLMMDEKVKTRRADLREIKTKLQQILAKANGIIEKYSITDQKGFDLWFLTTGDLEGVKGQYEYKINKLLSGKKPRISTAEKYRTSLNSLIEFSHENLTFQEITPEFLMDYQTWYLEPEQRKDKKGNSYTVYNSVASVGINLRHLRAIFNQAEKLRVISHDIYPFGTDRYVIPEGGEEVKNFLTANQKDSFLNYKPETEKDAYNYDFAIFDYFANGINFADISNLKKGKVFDDHIIVERQKTEGRHKKIKRVAIIIHPRMREVMIRRRNNTINDNDYYFPILNDAMTEIEKFNANKRFVRSVNDTLAVIAKKLELPVKPTTYTLRHTFSAMVLEAGASTEQLQDMLGHGSAKTTENYKHGFSLANKKKFSEGL